MQRIPKLAAFGLCAFYAGIAGALLAHLGQSVNFEQFQLDLSIQYLAMIVIGGLGTVRGSLLGAAFVTLPPIMLRATMQPLAGLIRDITSALVSSLQLVLFGVVIVAFMLLQARGLASLQPIAWLRRGAYVGAACVQLAATLDLGLRIGPNKWWVGDQGMMPAVARHGLLRRSSPVGQDGREECVMRSKPQARH